MIGCHTNKMVLAPKHFCDNQAKLNATCVDIQSLSHMSRCAS